MVMYLMNAGYIKINSNSRFLCREKPIDYGDLEDSIRKTCLKSGLEDVNGFVTKCIQLYETTVVRHGLMLVGPTGSGKTRVSQ